ncbi:MAG TPA: site-2 protease family protein [Acidimicrobiales bacterium]|nr:site-2 protease family protein [Acidimicrobiales bacterium]
MRATIHLGRIGRTRVSANWSVGVVALIIAFSLADGILPSVAPGYSGGAYWAVSLVAATCFFASLLGHELAHAAVARRRGVAVRGIVLWALGGVTEMAGDAPDAGSELRIGIAGPAASACFAVVAGLLAWLFDAAGLSAPAVSALAWLAEMNLLLAVFNLLPAYPLDGGRVLRAGLWRHFGDRLRATDAAARVGSVLGGLMIGVGALGWVADRAYALDGIWLALVGWFVLGASRQEALAVRAMAGLSGLFVRDAMVPLGWAAPSYATIEDLVGRHLGPNQLESCPLVDFSGQVSGLVGVDQLAGVPRAYWPLTRVSEVAWPAASLARVAPGDPLGAIAAVLAAVPSHGALVVDGWRVVGTLSGRDLERLVGAGASRTGGPGGRGGPGGPSEVIPATPVR